jgi:hypothetical protein
MKSTHHEPAQDTPATGQFLTAFARAEDRASAVHIFFEALAPHQERIAATECRADAIFRFQTPDRPFIQYDVTDAAAGLEPQPPQWAKSELDHTLAWQLTNMILTLDALPESDYVPMLNPGYGTSDLLPRMLGAEFDVMPDGACLPKALLLRELATDLPALTRPDPATTEPCRAILDTSRFLVEATEGRLPIVYPQMQGPTTNAVRLMDQEDYLVACLTEPELVRALSESLTTLIIAITRAFWQAIGDPALARPRQRGVQPAWVRGLLVDDYISVLNPDTYLAVAGSSWALMAESLGPIFLHTCGPTLQCGDMLLELPGLIGFETTFVDGFSKTTADLEAQKALLQGRVSFQSFILPDNRTVQDEEHLTADWLRAISAGGGFLLHAGGTAAEGRAFLQRMHA